VPKIRGAYANELMTDLLKFFDLTLTALCAAHLKRSLLRFMISHRLLGGSAATFSFAHGWKSD